MLTLNLNIDNLFTYLNNIIDNIYYKNIIDITIIINELFIYINKIIYSLNKVSKKITYIIEKYEKHKKEHIIKIKDINKNLNMIESNILKNYYTFIDLNNNKNNLHIDLIHNNKKYLSDNMDDNLDIFEFDEKNIYEVTESLLQKEILDTNYIDYKLVNIGFNNYYKLHCYKKLDNKLPFNLLIYIQDLDQVVLKIGNENKFRYINSKLYKIYINKIDDNYTSILCNNNIKELKKKCYNNNCKYYHDKILGYNDNYHLDRKFSNNPIVFNYIDFKDGSKTKEYTNKVKWHEAINVYQSNLSTLLIGCIHSLNDI